MLCSVLLFLLRLCNLVLASSVFERTKSTNVRYVSNIICDHEMRKSKLTEKPSLGSSFMNGFLVAGSSNENSIFL